MTDHTIQGSGTLTTTIQGVEISSTGPFELTLDAEAMQGLAKALEPTITRIQGASQVPPRGRAAQSAQEEGMWSQISGAIKESLAETGALEVLSGIGRAVKAAMNNDAEGAVTELRSLVDRMEANGEDVSELRAELAKLEAGIAAKAAQPTPGHHVIQAPVVRMRPTAKEPG